MISLVPFAFLSLLDTHVCSYRLIIYIPYSSGSFKNVRSSHSSVQTPPLAPVSLRVKATVFQAFLPPMFPRWPHSLLCSHGLVTLSATLTLPVSDKSWALPGLGMFGVPLSMWWSQSACCYLCEAFPTTLRHTAVFCSHPILLIFLSCSLSKCG